MSHVVLLGDSVFDNAAYVGTGPDVVRQLGNMLGPTWTASLLAVDGNVVRDVRLCQVPAVAADATHLVISAGGNDALLHSDLLEKPASSVGEALVLLRRAQDEFRTDYLEMLDAILELQLPTAVSTIYDTAFPEPYRTLVVTALTLFNDAITRLAFERGLPLLDLRLICDDPRDFANPIEPSIGGGGKIASAIASFVGSPASPRSIVFTGA